MRFQYIIISGSIFRKGGQAGDDHDVILMMIVPVLLLLLLRGGRDGDSSLESELMEVPFSDAVGGGLFWGWLEFPHGSLLAVYWWCWRGAG